MGSVSEFARWLRNRTCRRDRCNTRGGCELHGDSEQVGASGIGGLTPIERLRVHKLAGSYTWCLVVEGQSVPPAIRLTTIALTGSRADVIGGPR